MAYEAAESQDYGKFPIIERTFGTTPLYAIGDSHSLCFSNMVFTEEVTGQTFVTRCRYLQAGFTMENFYQPHYGFHPDFRRELEHEGLVRNCRSVHLSADKMDLTIAQAQGVPSLAPMLLLTCGDIDLRLFFLPHFKEDRDFVLPGQHVYENSDRPLVPSEICRNLVDQRVSLLARALGKLRTSGFSRTFLLGIVPPTNDDALFEKVNKYRCPRDVRYKAAQLFNTRIAAACQATGVTFIDIWSDLTENELDGVHVSRSATMFALNQVVRYGLNHFWTVNFRRYEIFYSIARGEEPINAEPSATSGAAPQGELIEGVHGCPPRTTRAIDVSRVSTQLPEVREMATNFERDGICSVRFFDDLIRHWLGMLDFSEDVGNRNPSFDWMGNSIAPFSPHLRHASPSLEFLDSVRSVFSSDVIERLFHTLLGCPIRILNCRPFMSLPHSESGAGPQNYHRDGCPLGIIRGIVYLTDVDSQSGPFEFRGEDGIPRMVMGPAGTMIIFDANRLEHRGSPPRKTIRKALDLVIAPRLPNDEFVVIDAGMNNWPYDPFQFSLHGMKSSPAMRHGEISSRLSF
jgi:hypothetical protein